MMTQSWETIREFYATLATSQNDLKKFLPIGAMLDLTIAIEQSRYASGLQAWTSMHDLCIVQTPVTYPYVGPYLRITPLENGNLEFRYLDTPKSDQQWHRVVDPATSFARLEKFIDQLQWFTNVG